MWFWRRFFSFSVLTVSFGLGLGLEPLWTRTWLGLEPLWTRTWLGLEPLWTWTCLGLDKGGLDYSPIIVTAKHWLCVVLVNVDYIYCTAEWNVILWSSFIWLALQFTTIKQAIPVTSTKSFIWNVIYIIWIVMNTWLYFKWYKNSFGVQNKALFLCTWLWGQAWNSIYSIKKLFSPQGGVIAQITYCFIFKYKEIITLKCFSSVIFL